MSRLFHLSGASRSTLCRTFILLVLFSALPAAGQSTEAEALLRLKGKPLFLRGFWNNNDLKFDINGQPQKDYHGGTFTQAGIDVYSAKIKGDRLLIEGQRVGLEFDPSGGVKRIAIRGKDYDGRVRIEVQAPAGSDFGKALDAIFAADLAEVATSVPSFWADYANKHFSPSAATSAVPNSGEVAKTPVPGGWDLKHVGGSVRPPRLTKSVDPNFSDVARLVKSSGNVQVYLWVDTSGVPSHLRIVKPAGMGLDEEALAAVQQYRFKPAMQDDKPVSVDLYIDVKFQIF